MTLRHHHHSHADGSTCAHGAPPEEALRLAERSAAERGLRMTAMRRDVLAVLAGSPRPLGAYEIIEQLQGDGRRKPAPILVYRALDFLLEAGFIHRIQSTNAFFACVHGHAPGDLVVLMVCNACGCAAEADSSALRADLEVLTAANHFRAERSVVELMGRCAHCQDASA